MAQAPPGAPTTTPLDPAPPVHSCRRCTGIGTRAPHRGARQRAPPAGADATPARGRRLHQGRAGVFTLRSANSHRGRTVIAKGTLRIGNADGTGQLAPGWQPAEPVAT